MAGRLTLLQETPVLHRFFFSCGEDSGCEGYPLTCFSAQFRSFHSRCSVGRQVSGTSSSCVIETLHPLNSSSPSLQALATALLLCGSMILTIWTPHGSAILQCLSSVTGSAHLASRPPDSQRRAPCPPASRPLSLASMVSNCEFPALHTFRDALAAPPLLMLPMCWEHTFMGFGLGAWSRNVLWENREGASSNERWRHGGSRGLGQYTLSILA